MANPVWGILAKSAVDNETIEEAIVRLIAVHNDDEEAHLATGQSLQSHKASEIIDHLALSIIADKLSEGSVVPDKIGMLIFQTFFESTDGYVKTSGVAFEDDNLKLLTTAVTDNTQSIYKRLPLNIFGLTFSKKRIFEVSFLGSHSTYINATIYVGAKGINNHIGFKLDDGVIYGSVGDGVTETEVELEDLDPIDRHFGRVVFTPDEKCEFYVDGVLLGTIDADLPSGTTWAHNIVTAEVIAGSNSARWLYLGHWDFRQEP